MPDTKRSLPELQILLADNTSGDISPQDTRDFLISVYSGGLEATTNVVDTSNVTGVAGSLHVCTIAGLTANRNFELPSANVGERIGVYIPDGDDTYSLILIGAASQTINGGPAATEWSRVFIKGELVIFRCIDINTWIVEVDGRIPCECLLLDTSASTGRTDATDTEITSYDSTVINTGDAGNASTGRVTARRAGTFIISGRTRFAYNGAAAVSDGSIAILMSKVNGANDAKRHDNYELMGTSGFPILTLSHAIPLAVSDYVSLFSYLDYAGGSDTHQLGTATWNYPRFHAIEQLS